MISTSSPLRLKATHCQTPTIDMSASQGQAGFAHDYPTPSAGPNRDSETEGTHGLSDLDDGDDDEREYLPDIDEFSEDDMDPDYEETEEENEETPAWDDASPDMDENTSDESDGGAPRFSIPSALLEAIAGSRASGVQHLVGK